MQELIQKIKPLLRDVKHPSRYIGGEFGAPQIDASADQLNFCMVYPDVYDIGQSNQAVQILCNKANEVDGIAAQRSFLPEVPTKEIFEKHGIPMFSLETFSPLSEFDAVGITISHELLATNVCETLDYAGISIFARDRSDGDPIIFGGGPMWTNPEPYFAFFDVITIGEGEVATINALKKLKELKDAGISRDEILKDIAKLPSMYVPSIHQSPEGIKRAVYADFHTSPAFDGCIVPFAEIVHNRLNIEVLRGCTRGCRFCQAGIMYRPVRERNVKNIVDSVEKGLTQTGHDEVSLVSLSTTDHSQIEEILSSLNKKFRDTDTRVSIPSQRLDSFGVDMAKLVAGNKKGGLTFAIEAGTQRLRDVINKNVTEDDIMTATKAAFENGWNRAKLYFMVGLPGETDEDLVETANLCERVLACAKDAAGDTRKHGITISVSCAIFVPKAMTPFMFDGQISMDEAMRRINLIRQNLKSKAINFSWHDPKTSMIEAVLSRGGRECNDLIYSAWKNGAKFDAWDEYFDFDAWTSAAKSLGLDLQDMASKSIDYTKLDKNNFFVRERIKASKAQKTEDCSLGKCQGCGICDELGLKNQIAGER